MAMLAALGVMSLFWMAIVAVLASVQKLLPARAAIDVPLALALIGLGVVIVVEPALIPGLMPAAG
jgi:predicted metal-binding membrane protein